MDAIKGSIKKFGQQTPVVYDPKSMCILKGNGTFKAMCDLGYTEIAAITTDLEASVDKSAYRIADNRSSEFAEWDVDALHETLSSLEMDDFDIESIGFDDWKPADQDDDPPAKGDKSYGFLVKCKNEKELLKLQNFFATTRSSITCAKFGEKVSV